MYVPEKYPWSQRSNGSLLRAQHDLIHLFLYPAKSLPHRKSPGHIACIMHPVLRPCVAKRHLSRLHHGIAIMIVQDLSIHGKDGGKREITASPNGNTR